MLPLPSGRRTLDAVPPSQMTLLMLPSVPLLRVLAMLEPKDLIAAGRASPRLGALTRANTSLWKESEVWDQDVMTLLQVIPPVDTLKAEVEPLFSVSGEPLSVPLRPRDASGTPDPTFSYPRYSGSVLVGRRSELVLKESKSCYYSEFIAVSLIWELAPRLKHLEVSQLELGIFLQFLESAFCLETLRIRNLCTYSKNASVPWPQDVRVPRLHTVSLSGRCPDRDVTALRSLLLAHRGQLRHVDLSDLSSPLPLLDACPDNLHRLGVKVEDAESCVAVAKTLHRMQGQLKELKMNFRFADADLVQDSLASWGGPLERLEFENYYPETLRVVGAGGLSGLQHLVLVRPRGDDPGEVSAALSGLPRLRSLVLRAGLCMLPPEAFLDIPAANPDLELLVVVGITKYNCLCLYKDEPVENFECSCGAAIRELGSVLADLVRRAPLSLHAALGSLWNAVDAPFARHRRDQCIIRSRHSAAYKADCQLCPEAVATVARYIDCPLGTITTVQVPAIE